MKQIIGILIIFTTILNYTFSQTDVKTDVTSIHWYSFEEAVALNKQHPRKMFIDIYTNWCGWCKHMDSTTFKHPYIINYIQNQYYPVKLNAEYKDTIRFEQYVFVNPTPNQNRSAHQLAISLLNGKMGYPSYVFMDEKYQILTVLSGYQKAQGLEPVLKFFADNIYVQTKWEDYQKTFVGEIK